tara:strand:+ start:2174 stop:2398 length:225 start_codon:yes stop_codon:yes gene_type:complete
MVKVEKLDLNNVIEIVQIKTIITKVANDSKPLLEILNNIILLANKKLNTEKAQNTMAIEVHREPILSDSDSESE